MIGLLEYVKVSTGRPHYEEVSELLEHFFSDKTFQEVSSDLAKLEPGGARKKKKVAPSKLLSSPDAFSAGALRIFYLRSARYGLRKTKPASKPR